MKNLNEMIEDHNTELKEQTENLAWLVNMYNAYPTFENLTKVNIVACKIYSITNRLEEMI